ncbi:septum formation protein Maf [bacterium BMS3Abin04]|nr:septum formation protein Maf [bacterium BMS3Abin04]
MMEFKTQLYLASKSPRRAKLLKQVNLKFKILEIDLVEEFYDGEYPVRTVKRLAAEKMELAKLKVRNGIIITADTIVVLNRKIIGKPKDKADAVRILKSLSNRTHYVYTGFAIYNSLTNKLITDYQKTAVIFRKLNIKEIKDYVNTQNPLDKAGAYGIQDFGAVFIKKVNGCFYNVMGLPLEKLYSYLKSIR